MRLDDLRLLRIGNLRTRQEMALAKVDLARKALVATRSTTSVSRGSSDFCAYITVAYPQQMPSNS